jgi:hypothetical protein
MFSCHQADNAKIPHLGQVCLPELLLDVFHESYISRIQVIQLTSDTLYQLLAITTVAYS